MRKIKYGSQVLVVSSVIRDLAEEVADLTLRFEDDNPNVPPGMLEQHRAGLVERIQARCSILKGLTETLANDQGRRTQNLQPNAAEQKND